VFSIDKTSLNNQVKQLNRHKLAKKERKQQNGKKAMKMWFWIMVIKEIKLAIPART
jgi:hypothetical protein